MTPDLRSLAETTSPAMPFIAFAICKGDSDDNGLVLSAGSMSRNRGQLLTTDTAAAEGTSVYSVSLSELGSMMFGEQSDFFRFGVFCLFEIPYLLQRCSVPGLPTHHGARSRDTLHAP